MKTATQQEYEARMLRVLLHIQNHLDDALDLDALASLACFSPFHFHRVFRGMVGEPVMEHVRGLRLERAAGHLKTSDRPITAIAFDAGYESHEAFTRAFRAMFDASPSEFRARRRGEATRRAPCGVHYAPDASVRTFEPLRGEVESMNVRIEHLTPMRIAFMRHVGPYDQVGAIWQKFIPRAMSRGLFPAARILAVVHDDPDVTPADRLRYDAGVGVDERFQPEPGVGVEEVAGGDYAIARHRGPYNRLGETYAALMGQWLPANNREPADGPCLESYLNNSQQTPPEELLTEVYVPLRSPRHA